MIKVRLYTSDGHYVVTGIIPPFQTMPLVLIWGDRVFHRMEASNDNPEGYFECFAVAVVEQEFEA